MYNHLLRKDVEGFIKVNVYTGWLGLVKGNVYGRIGYVKAVQGLITGQCVEVLLNEKI